MFYNHKKIILSFISKAFGIIVNNTITSSNKYSTEKNQEDIIMYRLINIQYYIIIIYYY